MYNKTVNRNCRLYAPSFYTIKKIRAVDLNAVKPALDNAKGKAPILFDRFDLICLFPWASSKEGFDYWREVYLKIHSSFYGVYRNDTFE